MKTTLVDIPTEGMSPASLEAQVRCLWTYIPGIFVVCPLPLYHWKEPTTTKNISTKTCCFSFQLPRVIHVLRSRLLMHDSNRLTAHAADKNEYKNMRGGGILFSQFLFSTNPALSLISPSYDCRHTVQVLAEVHALNERADIDGIVVQMPIPTGVDSKKVPGMSCP